jgi:hypothetical protein
VGARDHGDQHHGDSGDRDGRDVDYARQHGGGRRWKVGDASATANMVVVGAACGRARRTNEGISQVREYQAPSQSLMPARRMGHFMPMLYYHPYKQE